MMRTTSGPLGPPRPCSAPPCGPSAPSTEPGLPLQESAMPAECAHPARPRPCSVSSPPWPGCATRWAAAPGTKCRVSRPSPPIRSRKPTRSPTPSRRGDRAALLDELGDLLFQVVYHARIAEEEGNFSFVDVAESNHRKMVSVTRMSSATQRPATPPPRTQPGRCRRPPSAPPGPRPARWPASPPACQR